MLGSQRISSSLPQPSADPNSRLTRSHTAESLDTPRCHFQPGLTKPIWAAKGIGDEKTKGSLEPGKFADMIVLSDDIMTIDPAKITSIKVTETIVGGTRVYQRPAS